MNGKYYASDNFKDDRINIRTYIYYLLLDVFVFFQAKNIFQRSIHIELNLELVKNWLIILL